MRPRRRNRASDGGGLISGGGGFSGFGHGIGGVGNGSGIGGGENHGRRSLYHCNFCGRDLSVIPRIKCAECADFDLCVECFSAGVEVNAPQHRREHPYRVVESLRFPLITPDWTADEEILLLEAIELYGLFNWNEVAEHVGSKSAQAAQEHYLSCYLKSPTAPLPDTTAKPVAQASDSKDGSGSATASVTAAAEATEATLAGAAESQGVAVKKEEGPDNQRAEGTGEQAAAGDEQGAASSAVKVAPNQEEVGSAEAAEDRATQPQEGGGEVDEKPDAAADQQQRDLPTKGAPKNAKSNGKKKGATSGPDDKVPKRDRENVSRKAVATAPNTVAVMDLIGYCPQRDEFDPDYDTEAETPLADLEFAEGDDEASDENEERKLLMLDIYYRRIVERQRRREFLVSKGLANIKKQMSAVSSRRKEDSNPFAPWRVFDQAAAKAGIDIEELIGLTAGERELRARIAWLCELRAAGVKTMSEADVYAADKRRRLGRKPGI